MKPSISTPFKATTNFPHPTACTQGLAKWRDTAQPALPSLFSPTAGSRPHSLCREALMEAIRQERPHPEEQAALYWVLAESNDDLSGFGTEHWPASIGVDNHSPASTLELNQWHAHPNNLGRDALLPEIVETPVAVTVRKTPVVGYRRRVIRNPVEELAGFPNQDNFAALASAYRSSGGIFRAEDLVRLEALGDGKAQAELIGSITSGQILSFQWRQSYWVPIFQFEIGGTVQKDCARQVILEFADTFDDWEKVVWFVQPNVWLDGARPLELMERRLPDVMHAARADRFVAAG